MALPDFLEPAVARSRLVSATERSMRTARVGELARSLVETMRVRSRDASRWGETAVVWQWGRRLVRTLSRAVNTSRLARPVPVIVAWTESSFLYRWLTADPEPEVIVIDLRETLTVGPFIAVLDRWIRTLADGTPTSTLRTLAAAIGRTIRAAPIRVASLVLVVAVVTNALASLLLGGLEGAGLVARLVVAGVAVLGLRVDLSWSELRETWAVRMLVAALEPPPPPDTASERTDDADRTLETDEPDPTEDRP